jgi:hypothetical protein
MRLIVPIIDLERRRHKIGGWFSVLVPAGDSRIQQLARRAPAC